MTEYAIVDNGSVVGFRDFAEAPSLPGKPYRQFLPTEYVTPDYDSATETLTGTYTDQVQVSKVVRTAVVRSLTSEEQLARYRDLPRPSFLFMMGKIGVSEAQVEALIDAMPDSTQQEADAKALALIVFRNQQTFKRDNALLATLTAAAGLSEETVNAAWKAAEALTW